MVRRSSKFNRRPGQLFLSPSSFNTRRDLWFESWDQCESGIRGSIEILKYWWSNLPVFDIVMPGFYLLNRENNNNNNNSVLTLGSLFIGLFLPPMILPDDGRYFDLSQRKQLEELVKIKIKAESLTKL